MNALCNRTEQFQHKICEQFAAVRNGKTTGLRGNEKLEKGAFIRSSTKNESCRRRLWKMFAKMFAELMRCP
eukprot:2558203-Rhodomonas_salina.2